MKNLQWMAALALALASADTLAAPGKPNVCGELANGVGPYDYRLGNIDNRLDIVQGAHFTPDVEQLIKGSRGSLGGDLDYTLRAIPNNVRALTAMARLGQKLRTYKVPDANYPVECYFDRAIRFQPNDHGVRVAYGNFLFGQNRLPEALSQLQVAYDLAPGNAAINYNLGLAHFRLKDYDKANLYAHRAYALGFELPGLRNMLTQAGQWKDVPADQLALPPAPAADPADEPKAAAPSPATRK